MIFILKKIDQYQNADAKIRKKLNLVENGNKDQEQDKTERKQLLYQKYTSSSSVLILNKMFYLKAHELLFIKM